MRSKSIATIVIILIASFIALASWRFLPAQTYDLNALQYISENNYTIYTLDATKYNYLLSGLEFRLQDQNQKYISFLFENVTQRDDVFNTWARGGSVNGFIQMAPPADCKYLYLRVPDAKFINNSQYSDRLNFSCADELIKDQIKNYEIR